MSQPLSVFLNSGVNYASKLYLQIPETFLLAVTLNCAIERVKEFGGCCGALGCTLQRLRREERGSALCLWGARLLVKTVFPHKKPVTRDLTKCREEDLRVWAPLLSLSLHEKGTQSCEVRAVLGSPDWKPQSVQNPLAAGYLDVSPTGRGPNTLYSGLWWWLFANYRTPFNLPQKRNCKP